MQFAANNNGHRIRAQIKGIVRSARRDSRQIPAVDDVTFNVIIQPGFVWIPEAEG